MPEGSQDDAEHKIQLPADIFGKKPQDEVAIFLQQLIFPSVAAVCHRVREVLRPHPTPPPHAHPHTRDRRPVFRDHQMRSAALR
jgi:hypothetical protein